MKRYFSIRRTLVIATAIMIAIEMAACATPTNRDGEGRSAGKQVARITSRGEWVRGQARGVGTVSVGENKPILPGEFVVPPGRHDVLVTAIWSNDLKDTTHLIAEVHPGKTYFALIYELERGQDPKTADVRQRSFGELMLFAGVAGVVQGLMVFGWPFALLYESLKTTSNERPFEGCCYVWLEDAETGTVVAGTSPRSSEGK